MKNPIDLDGDGQVTKADAKQGWTKLLAWGHAHTFTAGCMIGAVGALVVWPIVKTVVAALL